MSESNLSSRIESLPDKYEELETIKARLERVLSNKESRESIKSDFEYTFQQLGLSSGQAEELCKKIFEVISSDKPLQETEAEALKILEDATVQNEIGELTLLEVLDSKLIDRAELIFSQIKDYIKGIKGKVIDYGAGDGRVTQQLHDKLNLDVEGVDIRSYRAENITVPIKEFDGKRTEAQDGEYEAGVLTNVLHHERSNENILIELDRIVSDRLIIIETVPVGESEEEIESDKDRTFMNDYLYNRLFHNANVPVPGTYGTPEEWRRRFAKYGWKVIEEKDLGFDQPTIKDRHYLFVLEKNNS